MKNIIIKNDQGKTLRVHSYGDNQLHKFQSDLVEIKSFLPPFWKIEELDLSSSKSVSIMEDDVIRPKFVRPKTLYRFRKVANNKTQAYKNMLKSVYDHLKDGYMVKLWDGFAFVDKADFINYTRAVYLYEDERTIVMEVF